MEYHTAMRSVAYVCDKSEVKTKKILDHSKILLKLTPGRKVIKQNI